MAKKKKKKKKKDAPDKKASSSTENARGTGDPVNAAATIKIEEVPAEEIAEILEKAPPCKDDLTDAEFQELCKKAAERDDFFSTLQRTAADFENFQKRINRDKKNWSEAAVRSFLSQILAPIDDFDRAIERGEDESDSRKLFVGFKMVHEKLWGVLEASGLVRVESEGMPFDPLFHDAMYMEESDEYERPTVIEVFEQGFMLGAQVIRPAKVKVSKPSTKKVAVSEDDDTDPSIDRESIVTEDDMAEPESS